MLVIPKDSATTFNLIGLDPGSNTFGIALLNVDIASLRIVSSAAWTIVGERLVGKDSWAEELHGARFSRLKAIEENLLNLFNHYQPLIVVSESPFINNRFPQAGIALTEVICSVRRAVTLYDMWKELYMIPPSSVKNAIGASGNGNKDIVKESIIKVQELVGVCEMSVSELDEHSVDALAVAYALLQKLRNGTM